ncbi:MAG: dihydropteroate synthase [Desulfurococcales archaeon]|nr:dihydropteroate synthase [Desulfurococcales archaeon]
MGGARSRVVLVSTSSNEPLVREAARLLSQLGYTADVAIVGVSYPSSIGEREVCGLGVEDSSDTIIVVPGSSSLSRQPPCYQRARVVKGTTHLFALVDLAKSLGLEGLSPEHPGEEALGAKWWRIVYSALSDIRENYKRAWCTADLCPPESQPPILVVSDLYFTGYESTLRGAQERISEGADMVLIGYTGDRRGYVRAVERLADYGLRLGVDAPVEVMVEALEAGAHVGFSLRMGDLSRVPARLREEKAFVILPHETGTPRRRAESLLKALREAHRLGYSRLVLDTIAQPLIFPGFLDSILAARILKKELRVAEPVLVGINNVVELADSDSQGSIPVVTALVAEAGASMVMVSEESWKTRGATLEARIAADMVSLAFKWKTTIKNLGLSLLVAKSKRPIVES